MVAFTAPNRSPASLARHHRKTRSNTFDKYSQAARLTPKTKACITGSTTFPWCLSTCWVCLDLGESAVAQLCVNCRNLGGRGQRGRRYVPAAARLPPILTGVHIDRVDVERLLGFEKLSIEVDPQLQLIAGPNNAGKSSLLRVLETFFANPDGADLLRLKPLHEYYVLGGPRMLSSITVHFGG